MAILINSDGTVASNFAVGDGVILTNDSGAATITSDGATLAVLRGADPVGVSDFVTLDYFNTNAPTPTNATSTLKLDLAHNSPAIVDSTATFATNTYAFRIIVKVATAFDGTAGDAVMTVGWADGAGTGAEFLASSVVNLYSADTYIVDIIETNATGGASSIEINYTADTNADSTQGAAEIYVETVEAPLT